MKSILDNTNFIISKHQPKNLKWYFTRAEFTSKELLNQLDARTVTSCEQPRCGTCKVIIPGKTITFKNERKWEVKTWMDCKSRNVIYAMICPKCRSFYTGQTEHLRKRVTVHKEQIHHERYRHLFVSEHIAKCNGGKFNIMPIYQCQNPNRLFRESNL
jgi:ribosomal protein L31